MNESEPHRAADLSIDNIEVVQPVRHESKSLVQENRFIRKQNEVLRRELEKISVRLDGEIKKRLDDGKRKSGNNGEDISQMELQNAYKKCQIYKKEAQMYRKRLESVGDQTKMEDFQRRVGSYARDNLELKEEIKQLKKISKLQEKGLAQNGLEVYTKVTNENEKLREEVRILKKELDNYRRALEGSKRQKTHSSNFQDRVNEYEGENDRRDRGLPKRGDSKLQSKIKRKIRTQQSAVESNEELTDLMHQKAEKDYMKMKSMFNQKNKLRDLVDNLKYQLAQKDKQSVMLKEKISELRRNNQMLQNQIAVYKSDPDLTDSKVKKERNDHSSYPKGLKSKGGQKGKDQGDQRKRVLKKEEPVQQQQEIAQQIVLQQSKRSSYPKLQTKQPLHNVIKWSHQHLSSKIKQIQILKHPQGHIKDLHVRYQKGQPKKYDQSGSKLKYQIFVCSQDQYIKHIEGAFYNQYLQYLTITSNHRRVEKYGNFQQLELNQQAEHFQIEVKDREYPGALFGESDEVGIRKLGSFIHKQN